MHFALKCCYPQNIFKEQIYEFVLSYEFHCLIENGMLYICATDTGVSKQQPYGYLAEVS